MEELLLSRLYRAAASGETPSFLRAFVSVAFADLLRSCPGLAAHLFGDIISRLDGAPEVFTDVPATNDLSLDVVIQAHDGQSLLIENQIAPALEWFEERVEVRPTSHVDSYIAAARHRFAGRARVLVLSRSETDVRKGHLPSEIYAGSRIWPIVYEGIREFSSEASGIPAHLMQQFLDLLKEHDMNPSHPLAPNDADTIFAFDQLARNNLKLLDDAIGRIRQEFDLKATPNNRRLTGWYACSDRFQSGDLHIFFYLMFPPVPDLVARAAVQVTKESTQRGLASAAENGFRRGRWGSLWVERDYRRRHPFLALSSERQVEELVRFYQTPLARLAKAGLLKLTLAHHEAPSRQEGAGSQARVSPEAVDIAAAGVRPLRKSRPRASASLAESRRMTTDSPSRRPEGSDANEAEAPPLGGDRTIVEGPEDSRHEESHADSEAGPEGVLGDDGRHTRVGTTEGEAPQPTESQSLQKQEDQDPAGSEQPSIRGGLPTD